MLFQFEGMLFFEKALETSNVFEIKSQSSKLLLNVLHNWT